MTLMFCLLLHAAVSLGNSLADRQTVGSGCYGKDFSMTLTEDPVPEMVTVYFTPSARSSPQKLLLDKGKLKDPRYTVVSNSSGAYLEVQKLMEEDQGIFSVWFSSEDMNNKTLTLTVAECSVEEYLDYGQNFSIVLVGDILEFTREGVVSDLVVLWNSSSPTVDVKNRGRVAAGCWLKESVTQSDQGNYTLRRRSGKLMSTIVLTVVEAKESSILKMEEDLEIDLPFRLPTVTLLFQPIAAKCNVNSVSRPRVLVRDGTLVPEEKQSYEKRLVLSSSQIVLKGIQISDLGSYYIYDPQGNLALSVDLDIDVPSDAALFALLAGTVFLAMMMCCYGKGCCCHKGKRQAVAQTSGA
ncbi:uncharacterized protein LOC114796984 [Denticeps clupeoides]|uniref:uncharacterized protein LOC114796984 n=1 Tax=Denticeps clupeoides TaxID=299321 RepID=UPI0010A39E2E|nr:uncharacterized protein LOC114796984 [Denticeps clupeoides]